jgi:hypothetical protein
MLIRNKKAFARGLLLMASFIAVFVAFFLPIFPSETEEKVTGLVFADHLFNTLSKGSANFFDPTLQNQGSVNVTAKKVEASVIDVTVPFKEAELAATALTLLQKHNISATPDGSNIKIQGNLFPLLTAIINDSHKMYDNDSNAVGTQYGVDGKLAMRAWWAIASGMIKPLQRADQVAEASVVSTIQIKGIEASYNFYGITPLRVSDNIPLVAGFLIFYVIYTMWYGFAIFELFEGIGLTMTKAHKQEA